MSSQHNPGRRRWPIALATTLTVLMLLARGGGAGLEAQITRTAAPQVPKAVRLYVFDCGLLNITAAGVERYHVTPAEVGETRMSVPCFLVAHPRGTLMWDLGVISDPPVVAPGGARARTTRPLRLRS